MAVALVSTRNADATGVDRYASGLLAGLREIGADVAHVELARREWRIGRRAVGGLASLWIQRLVAAPGRWDLVHALDPAAAPARSDVVTVHDLIPETHPRWGAPGAAGRLDWRLSRRNARRARRLVAVSAATREEIVARWGVPRERVAVVHHGIDASRFFPDEEPSALVAPGRPTFAYAGDDHPRKHLDLAVRALGRFAARAGLRPRLVRAGPVRFPAQAAELRALAAREGVELVEPGYLDDASLRRLLASADAFLWPSLAEGFGFPPLEAMACGAPVVALDVPVHREILAEHAAFHPDDPDAAAAAIERLLAKPPDAQAAVAHARRFTWARAARETLAVYETLLG